MSRRTYAAIYLLIAFLQLVPIWSVHYLPTVDGPSHVYNALVLRDLVSGRGGAFAQTFRIDWRPQPNWIGTAAMALLLEVFSPAVAEKIFFSAIVLVFALAMWLYAGAVDRDRAPMALLALPFTFNWLLQAGFYNFSLGVALAFLAIALWWRRPRIIPTALLLVLIYFSHPMAVLFACASIGLIWLLRSRDPKRLAVFVPVLPLLVWYWRFQKGMSISGDDRPWKEILSILFGVRISWTFHRAQMIFGTIIVVLIFALVIIRVMGRVKARPTFRDEDVFLLLTILLIVLYFATPENAAGGMFLRERITLFLYLTPLPWIAITRWQDHFVRVLATVAVANIVYLTICYRRVEPAIEDFVRGVDAARPESTILAIVNIHLPYGASISVLSHALDYAAAERRLIDVNNYEADCGLFPIGFRSPSPTVDLATLDTAMWSLHVDSVYAYHLERESALAAQLRRYFRPIRISGDGWLGTRVLPRSLGAETLVLLPIAGTTVDMGAPIGIRFRVEQTMRNAGTAPIHAVTSMCALTPSCTFDLDPGETVPLAGDPGKPPYILVNAPRGQVHQLAFSTTVRRTDDPTASAPVSVPAVTEQDFLRGRAVIPDVPTNLSMNLRVWFFDKPVPENVRVRVVAARTGALIGEKTFAVWPFGFMTTTSIDHDFDYHGQPATFIIESADRTGANSRLWAFVSTTDYKTGKVTLSLPR